MRARHADPRLWDRTWRIPAATEEIGALDQRIFAVLEDLLDLRGLHLLELGAGSGHLCRLMLSAGAASVTLVDFSPAALERARRTLSAVAAHCTFLETDLFELPDEPRHDLVFSSGLAEHFSGELRSAVVHKHLSLSREWVCFIVPARPHLNTIRHRRARTRERYGWQRAFSREELVTVIEQTGTYRVQAARRLLPLYGVSLLDLLGAPDMNRSSAADEMRCGAAHDDDGGTGRRGAGRSRWNRLLSFKDRLLSRLGFYAVLERMLEPHAGRWGGLLVVTARRAPPARSRGFDRP